MRSVFLTCSFFMLIGLVWAVGTPLLALLCVKQLGDPSADHESCIASLDRAGSGASFALEQGMKDGSPQVRLRCARVLASRGDSKGMDVLFETLRKHGAEDDSLGALAEAYLIAVWDQRDGPPQPTRAKINSLSHSDFEDQITVLNDALEKFPGWVAGYVRRGQLYQAKGDALEIRREALTALAVQPENFEALTLLATAYLKLNAPQQAFACLDRAARINPRMQYTHSELIRQTVKALDAERARRRREKRKEIPIAELQIRKDGADIFKGGADIPVCPKYGLADRNVCSTFGNVCSTFGNVCSSHSSHILNSLQA